MDEVPSKPKKAKSSTKEELLLLEKNELVDRILQLEAHNAQLKNIISKNQSTDVETTDSKRKRAFDFTKCHYRRVLLRILYLGWDYQGLAVQEDTHQTIEHHLFCALTKCCLVQSRQTSQYHRCGRTDKGVSSFGQVISITLRSLHPSDQQGDLSKEMPYCKMLNRLLPKEIRAVAWMPIPEDKPEYSARFDCKKRKYKYYFPRSSLDITAMRTACSHLIGSHDFRHLCKMDVGNGVVQFTREIISADIVRVDEMGFDSATTMYCLLIEGNAFLWHQIRCIMGVLLLIGQRKELPEVVRELLDVDKNLRKPQYNMAMDVPLNLFQCSYDIESTSNWYFDKDELGSVIRHLQGEWTHYNVKATMIKDMLQELETQYQMRCTKETADAAGGGCERDSIISHADCLLQGVKPRVYVPLMERETCSSLEERIEFYKKKRKISPEANEQEKQ